MTNATWDDLPLHDVDRDKLISSAVSPTIAAMRGYYTETSKKALKALGFADYQALAPAMVIPLISPHPEGTGGYQIKPLNPRMSENHRPIKYESPAHSTGAVNCGPLTYDNCDHPDYPLIVTEGPIKADALESAGYNALSLAGVFNFSYRDGRRALPLPDWDDVVLAGRRVGIMYDYPDIYDNDLVALAALRLQAFLKGRGANAVLLDVHKAVNAYEYGRGPASEVGSR